MYKTKERHIPPKSNTFIVGCIISLCLQFALYINTNAQTYQQQYDSINYILSSKQISKQKRLNNQLKLLDITRFIGVDSSTTEKLYNETILLAKKQKNKEAEIEAKYNYANTLRRNSNYEKAKKLLFEINKELTPEDIAWKAKTLNKIASIAYYSGEYDRAYKLLTKAEKYAEASNNPLVTTEINQLFAAYFYMKSMYQKSLKHAYKALKIATKKGYYENQATLYNIIGCIFNDQGNYQNAISNYSSSMKMNIINGDQQGVCITLYNIAEIYSIIEEYDNAIATLDSALNIAQNINFRRLEIHINYLFGSIYYNLKNAQLAISYLTQCINICNETNNKNIITEAYILLAKTYKQNNQLKKANDTFSMVINCKENNKSKASALTNLYLIDEAIEKQNYKLAESLLNESLELSTEINDITKIHEKFIQTYSLQKNYKEALYHTLYLKEIKDSIKDSKVKELLSTMSLKNDFEKEKEIIEFEKRILEERKNKEITTEKSKTLTILLVLIIGIILLIFLSIQIKQRQNLKTKKVEFLKAKHEVLQLEKYLEGEEYERKQISEELHNNISQNLNDVKNKLKTYNENSHIEKPIKQIDKIFELVNNIAFNLSPSNLQNKNLTEAVAFLCKNFSIPNKTFIEFNKSGEEPTLEKNRMITIYRIIQELLNNTLKHAKATNAWVEITYQPKIISITVKDNGVGFDINKKTLGIGLQNIKSRLDFLAAKHEIHSTQEGTIFKIIVPS